MFERFTKQLRHAVIDAQECARDAGAAEITTEHLLFGLLTHADSGVAAYLADCLPLREQLAEQFRQAHRRGGLSETDAAALAELGIDVDKVVAAVERSHGELALAPERETAGKSRRKRLLDHIPFSGNAKRTLERSLRESLRLGDRHIGGEHLLLALLSGPGPVADVLGSNGITEPDLRAALAHRRAS